jgi:hypothetical protein
VRRYTRSARTAALVAAFAASLMSGATAALAKPAQQTDASPKKSATAPLRPPGGFCGYWGPLYSYVFPDGTVLRCS